VHRWWHTPRTRADLTARRQAIAAWAATNYGFLGRSPDHVASFFAGFAGSLSLFAEGGQQFADNVQRFYERARDESLYLSYAIIHPTVDRAKPPHQQYEPNAASTLAGLARKLPSTGIVAPRTCSNRSALSPSWRFINPATSRCGSAARVTAVTRPAAAIRCSAVRNRRSSRPTSSLIG
jgi:hypothetical protein